MGWRQEGGRMGKGRDTGMKKEDKPPQKLSVYRETETSAGQKHPHCATSLGVPASGRGTAVDRSLEVRVAQPRRPGGPGLKLCPKDIGWSQTAGKGLSIPPILGTSSSKAGVWAPPFCLRG